MHKMMEAIVGEELEVLPTYFIDDFDPIPDVNIGIYYLSKSLELLAQADYFIGFSYYVLEDKHVGCEIEMATAEGYGIPSVLIKDRGLVEMILEDLKEV